MENVSKNYIEVSEVHSLVGMGNKALQTFFGILSKFTIFDCFCSSGGDMVVNNDVSTLENTTGEVTTSPPPPAAVLDASVISPTSPTTDTEHTTGTFPT